MTSSITREYVLIALMLITGQRVNDIMVKLNLGSGRSKKLGYINLDINLEVEPDVIVNAIALQYNDESVSHIEALHLIEHFTLKEAKLAFREWYRVLKPGGTMGLELPNLHQCILMIQSPDPDTRALVMGGIFGHLPEDDYLGEFQVHKWGWYPESICKELNLVGFSTKVVEPTQPWRRAYKYGRDMRVECTK